ncbi:MAG: DUF1540 domain-containing protein [Bacillota bacterium]
MQRIKCSVTSCYHNQHGICEAEAIEVNYNGTGPAGGTGTQMSVATSRDTLCETYRPKDTEFQG